MRRILITLACAVLITSSVFAIDVVVDPVSGTNGSNPTDTIVDAIAQINAGADESNSVTLLENGVHVIPASTVSTINNYKSINFSSEVGADYAVIRLSTGGQYNWTINQDAATTGSVTFKNIGIIPQAGQTYGNNSNDGLRINNGTVIFADCVLTNNNGSDGLGSINGDAAYTGTDCVGDDWVQAVDCALTFSNCTITGCNDDAILINNAGAGEPLGLVLEKGTFVGNNGGAGVQVYGANVALVLDGSEGRVLIANCGQRPSTTDTGIKFFWDTGCSLTMNKADVIGCTNAAIYDFEGVPEIDITDSRIALGNSGSATPGGNFVINDTSNDSPYVQTINITRSTLHDCLGADPEGLGIRFVNDSANDPQPTYNITDSIISGAGDTFVMLGNAPTAVNRTGGAIVTAGPDAIVAPGDLGTTTGAVVADPAYVTQTYATGRHMNNGEFLLPSAAAYLTAAPDGGILKGGSPATGNDIQTYHREVAATEGGLQVAPDGADLLNGNVCSIISGGWHPANTNPADQEPAFTDGAGLAGLAGLLNDFPGAATPAISVVWDLGGPTDIGEIRVFSGNAGADGRIFHNYDAYVTYDSTPTTVSLWTPMVFQVTPTDIPGDNNASDQASLSVIQSNGSSHLAYGATGLRMDFYSVSNTAKAFWDPYDPSDVKHDIDGQVPTIESPLITEVDVYGVKTYTPPSSVSDWNLF